jgi:BirA family biotin operon repressor/biotin-[acetyl-CoA-carboxylase] ligase
MIDIEKIKKNQKSSLFGTYAYYFPEIDSTNSYAQQLAQEGAPEGTVVLSDFQTEGKGRLNRVWESSKDANILMSIVLRPRLEIERAVKITLATSEILISSFEKYLNKFKIENMKFSVKWPNDILANGKKIAGILTESSLREKDIIFVIVGVGVNVNQDLSILSDDVRLNATSLFAETGKVFDRESLIAEIITEFERQYFNLERTNYDQVMLDWKNRCDHIGKEIIIETHVGTEKGKFVDVTEKGILLKLAGPDDEKELVAGTIKSLKVVNGSDG